MGNAHPGEPQGLLFTAPGPGFRFQFERREPIDPLGFWSSPTTSFQSVGRRQFDIGGFQARPGVFLLFKSVKYPDRIRRRASMDAPGKRNSSTAEVAME